jgi:hypothetical protein
MNVTPSLPQRGRQTKGRIPLTPLSLLCFCREFLIILLRSNSKTVKNFVKKPTRLAVPRRGPEAGEPQHRGMIQR